MSKEKNAMLRNSDFYFKSGITWNRVGYGAARIANAGFAFDDVSPTGFAGNNTAEILAYMNSFVFKYYLSLFSAGFKVEIGHIQKVPYRLARIPRIEWYVTTFDEAVEFVKDSKLPYRIRIDPEKPGEKTTDIGEVHNGSFDDVLYVISTDYMDIHVYYLSLDFEKEDNFILSGATIISADPVPTLKDYFMHFYKLDVDFDYSDLGLLKLSEDNFSLLFAAIGDDSGILTYVSYTIVPDHINIGDASPAPLSAEA